MAEYLIQDTTLQNIADAIRTKDGTTDVIPVQEMATKISNIQTGVDTSDATATASDMASGVTAYVNGEKITGNVTVHDSGTYGWTDGTVTTYSGGNWDNKVAVEHTMTGSVMYKSPATVVIATQLSNFGNATAADVASGKTFTSSAGLKVTGTASSGYKEQQIWWNDKADSTGSVSATNTITLNISLPSNCVPYKISLSRMWIGGTGSSSGSNSYKWRWRISGTINVKDGYGEWVMYDLYNKTGMQSDSLQVSYTHSGSSLVITIVDDGGALNGISTSRYIQQFEGYLFYTET